LIRFGAHGISGKQLVCRSNNVFALKKLIETNKVKVNFTVEQAIKTHRASRVMAVLFL
jgi:hypothetical protein